MSIISNYRNQNKQGLTLIEVLIGITIFGVLVAAVFGIYQSVQSGNQANEAGRNIQTIFNNTEKVFRRSDTDDLSTVSALQLGIIPAGMNEIGGTIYNVFEGEVTLEGDGPRGYVLTYNEVPTGDTCTALIQSQQGVGWDEAQSSSGGSAIDIIGDDQSPVSDIASACDPDNNDVTVLTFTKLN